MFFNLINMNTVDLWWEFLQHLLLWHHSSLTIDWQLISFLGDAWFWLCMLKGITLCCCKCLSIQVSTSRMLFSSHPLRDISCFLSVYFLNSTLFVCRSNCLHFYMIVSNALEGEIQATEYKSWIFETEVEAIILICFFQWQP